MQWLRNILFPFSILYGGIVWLRNKLFDWGLLKAEQYDIPVICVGNLNVGGTGKSPMIEYLIGILKDSQDIATLSRGYGRRTKGFREVYMDSKAEDVGDEPLQFKRKFPKTTVVVHEKRVEGMAQLMAMTSTPDVVLLDDAYQHRYVTPSFTVLLTAYNDLYVDDFMLPTGNLREPKAGSNRANVIVVTKSPLELSDAEKNNIKKRLKHQKDQHVFFASIAYSDTIQGNVDSSHISTLENQKFTLVSGIANPQPLVEHLNSKALNFEHLKYGDHHNFTDEDIELLNNKAFILTTEKDYVRLEGRLNTKIMYLPISTQIDDSEVFNKLIISHLQ